jgi:hypothetical protein
LLLVEVTDDPVVMSRDLTDRLAREHLGVSLGLLDRLGVIRPPGRKGRITGLLEQLRPAIPTARQQPWPVNQHHRLAARRVSTRDLLGLLLGDPGNSLARSAIGLRHLVPRLELVTRH